MTSTLCFVICTNEVIHPYMAFLLFFFNWLRNACGFWPAQLTLSILSRKVFTECRYQRHVKPPTWKTSDYKVPTPSTRCPSTSETTLANPSSGRWNYGRAIAENFAESGDSHDTFGFFYMPYIYDMGPTALLPVRRMGR